MNNFLEFCFIGIVRLENEEDFCSLLSGFENEDIFLSFFFVDEIWEDEVKEEEFEYNVFILFEFCEYDEMVKCMLDWFFLFFEKNGIFILISFKVWKCIKFESNCNR